MDKSLHSTDVPSLADIKAARKRIKPYIVRTPLVRNETLSRQLGANVYLKLEIFQKTSAFKVRGAFNKILSLPKSQQKCGVVAVSGGNHAQAVAYAATTLGRKSRIFMPEATPRNYLDATRGYGAEVVLCSTIADAFRQMAAYNNSDWVAVHPFDDATVIAGQGTLGLEIYDQLSEVTDVFISIGGGGLIGGCSIALKTSNKKIRMWGVETEGANCMAEALKAGKIVQMPAMTSIAVTLGPPAVCERTLALAQKYLESVTVVPDSEAFAALQFLLERAKILVEPAGSCTLAAAQRQRFTKRSHVVLVLCGGNVALADVCHWRTRFGGSSFSV
jgi:threonine dehydratase